MFKKCRIMKKIVICVEIYMYKISYLNIRFTINNRKSNAYKLHNNTK